MSHFTRRPDQAHLTIPADVPIPAVIAWHKKLDVYALAVNGVEILVYQGKRVHTSNATCYHPTQLVVNLCHLPLQSARRTLDRWAKEDAR